MRRLIALLLVLTSTAGCPGSAGPTLEDAGPACGNGLCEQGESNDVCPGDCPLAVSCGDGSCDPGESSATCSKDCPAPVCGDGECSPEESPASCAEDCAGPVCGDARCDAGETTSCPKDCATGCGDSHCVAGETTASCPRGPRLTPRGRGGS